MTDEERALAVTTLGFTTRQARFLVIVMLHGGVFLTRHYCTFAGIAHGKAVRDFCQLLLEKELATCNRSAHGRTLVFHIHGKAMYRKIGEVDNRNRRPVPLPRAFERIMVLDAVLSRPDLMWLATERDKVTYFSRTTRLQSLEFPHIRFGQGPKSTVRFFPDKLPIGISADGQVHVFVYLATRGVPVDFRAFLHRHANLLRMVPSWTLRLLFPSHLAGAVPTFQAAARDELASPLQRDTLDELRWFFEQRRRGVEGSGVAADARFERAKKTFATPRFSRLYRSWMQYGEEPLLATLSPLLADAMARRRGTLECEVLPHPYQRLEPIVGSA